MVGTKSNIVMYIPGDLSRLSSYGCQGHRGLHRDEKAPIIIYLRYRLKDFQTNIKSLKIAYNFFIFMSLSLKSDHAISVSRAAI